MNQLLLLLKKDLMDLYRNKKILILIIVFLLIGLLSPLFALLTPQILEYLSKENSDIIISIPDPTFIDSYMQFFKNISQIGLFILIIVYSSLIVEERQKGMFANLIINGANKYNFVLAKVISQIIVFTIIYLVSILLFFLYTYILFEQVFTSYFLISFISYYVYIIFLIGIINLISSITKTVITTIVFNFLILFGLMLFDIIPKIGKYLPNYLSNIANNIIIDANYFSYFGYNIIITIILFMITIFLAGKLCNNIE